jgi:hypothetical protein
VFQRIVLGVSDREWGKQKFVVTRDTKLLWPSEKNDFDLDSDPRVGSQMSSFFLTITYVAYHNLDKFVLM